MANSKTILESKRSQLYNSVYILWRESLEVNSYSDVHLVNVWATSCEAATATRSMVSEIYAVAGTPSLYTKYKIERVYRDIHAVLQYEFIQPYWMEQAGMAYVCLRPTNNCNV